MGGDGHVGLLARFGLGRAAEGPEVEIRTADLAVPGERIGGQLVIRAGTRSVEVDRIENYLVADGFDEDGGPTDLVLGSLRTPGGYDLEIGGGQERTLPFGGRLPWECPFTELDGQPLGFAVAVRITLRPPGRSDGTVHHNTLRIAPTPAVRAAVAAFAELGYRPQDSRVVYAYIPGSDQHHASYQSLFLTDPARGRRKLPRLELSFVTNPVGTMVYLRRASPELYEWESKPRTVTFAVAHHEAARPDLAERATRALEELRTLYRS
ncbi:sporulation-control protein spo0M [Kitasatospora cineracea]|uniref:Sporulation-control protein spo0M n=1 Tax=Kitasatospora cineracea TaxID=88074 RepID=A0A8G1UMN0_9ACTN|nr:sporulation-control protein spo0M [Kitasatospora cineracea]